MRARARACKLRPTKGSPQCLALYIFSTRSDVESSAPDGVGHYFSSPTGSSTSADSASPHALEHVGPVGMPARDRARVVERSTIGRPGILTRMLGRPIVESSTNDATSSTSASPHASSMSGPSACPRPSRARTGANVATVAPSARAHVVAPTGASRASHGHCLTGSRSRALSPLGRGARKPVQGRTASARVLGPAWALEPLATVTGAPRGIPSRGARALAPRAEDTRASDYREPYDAIIACFIGANRTFHTKVEKWEKSDKWGRAKIDHSKGPSEPKFFWNFPSPPQSSADAHAPAASSPDDKPRTKSADCSDRSIRRPGPQ